MTERHQGEGEGGSTNSDGTWWGGPLGLRAAWLAVTEPLFCALGR